MKKIIYVLLSMSLVFSTIGLANFVKAEKPIKEDFIIFHNSSPVISSIGGPSVLNVGETGTWTITASDPENGPLTYSVIWGDETIKTLKQNAPFIDNNQTTTFTHLYNHQGTYTVIFTVTDNRGAKAKTSISVRVGNGVAPYIKVLSPNGGENWIKNTTQTIKWLDTTPFPTCPSKAYCVAQAPRLYDIELIAYYPPCTNKVCPTLYYPMSYTIATSVSAYSYDWKIADETPGYMINPGKYKIRVCDHNNTAICDSSNNYFNIIADDDNDFPIISSVSGPVKLRIGETGTWTITASDPENGPLTYSVIWGDEIKMFEQNSASTSNNSQQTATFTHSYNHAKAYTVIFTVTDNRGHSAKTILKVKVNSGESQPVVNNAHIGKIINTLNEIGNNASQSVKDKISQIIALLKEILTEL